MMLHYSCHSKHKRVSFVPIWCRAFARQDWQAAVDQYSQALAGCSDASAKFAAVLHSNRAAAYHGLGQHAEAIADCLRSKALSRGYAKVIVPGSAVM